MEAITGTIDVDLDEDEEENSMSQSSKLIYKNQRVTFLIQFSNFQVSRTHGKQEMVITREWLMTTVRSQVDRVQTRLELKVLKAVKVRAILYCL